MTNTNYPEQDGVEWKSQVDIYGVVGVGDSVLELRRTSGLDAKVFVYIPATRIKTSIDTIFFRSNFTRVREK